MIRVCIAGITGWTGKAIALAVDHADDLVLASGASRSAGGTSLAADLGVKAAGRIHA